MIIRKSRINNVEKYFGFLDNNSKLVFGVDDIDRFEIKLKKIGFEDKTIGTTILPKPVFGSISRINAEGYNIVHKDQEKEYAYRQIEWHWKQFSGYRETEDVSKIVDVPYLRYPRTFVSPPSIEFSIANDLDQNLIIITRPVELTEDNYGLIKHIVNLFLEIFGECSVYQNNLKSIWNIPVRKLNWTVLPHGKYPWSELKPKLTDVITHVKKGNLPVIEDRFKTITKFNVNFVAIGRAGFSGYVIFGFPLQRIFLLESIFTGNATYIFDRNWEELSKLTKAEILNQNLQTDRIIHRDGWHKRIDNLFEI